MKNYFILLFFLPFLLNAQNKKLIDQQKKWFLVGENDLKDRDLFGAFVAYRFSYDLKPESIIGKKSLKISDSIKNILRDNLKQEISGTWKLKIFGNLKDNEKHYKRLGKFLKVHNDSIFFYTNRRNFRKNISRIKFKIKFCDLMNPLPDYRDIIHSNYELWNYSLDSTKQKLNVLDYGKIERDGKNRTGTISHPSGYTYERIN